MSNIYDTAPAHSVVSVTKSDSTILAAGCRALYIGGAGDIVVKCWNDTSATFTAPAGLILPVKAKQVLSTGTTATAIVALY